MTDNKGIDYNSEPVYYCVNCLSLKIRGEMEGLDYCDCCGSTSIDQCNILEWENKYMQKTGHLFLEEKRKRKH